MEKILADTSVWVASFAKSGHKPLKKAMRESILKGELVMTGMVLLEILQGARNEQEGLALKRRLSILPFLSVQDGIWVEVAEFSLKLRSRGVQTAVPDLFTAWVAIKNGCILMHCDRDYERIAKHSDLKTRPFV